MKPTKNLLKKMLKSVAVYMTLLAILLTSVFSVGCSQKDEKLEAIESAIAELSSSSSSQIDELSAKVEALSSAAQIEELATKLSELSSSSQVEEMVAKLAELSSSAQIEELAKKVEGLSSSEQAEKLLSQISKLSTAEQLDELIDALIPTDDGGLADNYAQEAYEKLVYMDKVLKDRDCLAGEQFQLAQKWIIFSLIEAGYVEGVDIVKQDTTMTKYVTKQSDAKAYKEMYPAVDSIDVSTETYKRSGRNYVVAEGDTGTHVKVTLHTPNIVVTKQGNTDKTIIVGAHYDGDGSGDNASSVALAITTAQHLFSVETEYTIKFVFFTAEEYGMYGSTAFVNAMTDQEIENTLYMINMDSLGCGDYCYIYGGVQDDDTQTVSKTEAYDNAMALATEAGLSFKSNPWTYDNPAPGYDSPDYASPSTGDWSDHVPFKKAGITYLYFEATNWEIPGPYYEYDGYGETYLVGMIMNTPNDYLEYIETYFPGRPLAHLTQFSSLLNLLLTQTDYVQ